jgi:hypothetical protein
MTSVWGRAPWLPFAILDAVAAHARALGRTVADDDLFLVALTCLDEGRPVRRALAAERIDARRLLALIKVGGDAPVDPPAALTFAPAYYTLEGRAQGFAAALGDGEITPEHVLLASCGTPEAAPRTFCGGWAPAGSGWPEGGRDRCTRRRMRLPDGACSPSSPYPVRCRFGRMGTVGAVRDLRCFSTNSTGRRVRSVVLACRRRRPGWRYSSISAMKIVTPPVAKFGMSLAAA